MLTAELIRRKRDGGELSAAEIEQLVFGIADGSVTDAQVGALAMAIVWRGMTPVERVALTGAMMRSGDRLDWSDAGLDGPVLDKHSTGGVGDKVSLLLAPILAACGAFVPMISGRGLGHTGGTLDKLESIPGYDVTPDNQRLREAVARVGCAIVGQTARLAPADRRLYAIRDATGTVESIPLIVGSILSKKLAAGLDALVMDVKVGSGAFLRELDRGARARASDRRGRRRQRHADDRGADRHGPGAGPDCRQRGRSARVDRPPDRSRARRAAAGGDARAVRRGARARRAARRRRRRAGRGAGRAPERRRRRAILGDGRELGGPADLVEVPSRHLQTAPVTAVIDPLESGHVNAVDVRAVGIAIVNLGGGRAREDDRVDHSVGLTEVAALGERVAPGGRPLALVHARDDESARRAADAVRAAYAVGDPPGDLPPAVIEVQRAV